MKGALRWVTLMVLVLALSACDYAKKADLDALRAEHLTLKDRHDRIVTQLGTWSTEVYEWQNWTYQVICDVVSKNGPASKYEQLTRDYCGDTDGGAPKPPPVWGQ